MNNLAEINTGDYFFSRFSGSHGGNTGSFQSLSGVANIVSLFINISFAVAGIILLFYFIMGGIGMISSAGKNDPQKAEQAKKSITSALIGFVIVFASYWIVKLIGQLLGVDNLLF